MLSLFLLVSLGAYSVQSAPEVIVIGAGASGLAAARVLTDAGRYKVTVLEARPNRYGGRIWTNTENFHNATGPEVDMGASFIRYADEKNSVVQLHREYDLPLFEMDREVSLVVRGNDSMPYTKASVDAASMRVNKAFEAVGDLSSKLITDISVYKALSKLKQSPLIGDPLSQTFVSLQEFNFGAPIEKISTRYLKAGHVNAQAKTSKKIPALGFRKMIDRIVKKSSSDPSLNILLGQEVTEVNVREDKRVVIKCRNGETYKADAVIVTLPLGILKADNVKFSPSLTLKKRRAIRRVGFGTINKLVIKFNQRFWTVNTRQISVAASNIADRGKLTHLLSFHDIANKPVIVAYAVGHFGEESEKMTDNELEKLALSRLRTVFGTALNGANVVDLSRTKWKSDPFAMGSFSFPTVGIKEGDWDVLGEAEPPLFFAGEHTRTKQYGTVQTAIDTGRKAATDVETYLSSADAIPALSAFVNLCFVFLSILLSI